MDPDIRFNKHCNTISEAREYLIKRAKQLLRFGVKLTGLEDFEEGVRATFYYNNQTYKAFYVLKDYCGKNVYAKYIDIERDKVLTTPACGIIGFLNIKGYEFKSLDPYANDCYSFVSAFYGDKKAKRSGVEYMQHIDEGLFILDEFSSTSWARDAYILHPIFQMDEDLSNNVSYDFFKELHFRVLINVIEYRSVANEYLSKRKINSIDEIRLSPLEDVNDMLIADKIQNRKDFEIYHKGIHDRSVELTEYFNNWLERLGISEEKYLSLVEQLKIEI